MNTQSETHAALGRFCLPEYREIPDVGLYLDQVVKYINGFLDDYPQMKVTGTMLSNYVKMKLIPPAVKKAYSRDQICMLFIIVLAKRALSIEQAGKTLCRFSEERSPEEYYRRFRDALSARIREIGGEEKQKAEDPDAFLKSVTSAIVHCMYLDGCFAAG